MRRASSRREVQRRSLQRRQGKEGVVEVHEFALMASATT
jgi:hypothetical protein